MSKVILHIGTHKTASTTIQNTLYENSALLAKHGLVYPRLSKHAGHHGLVYGWKNMLDVYKLPEGSLATLEKIAKEHGASDRTVFLSSEEFSRERAIGEMGQMREILSAFDQIEVICVLRTQWQFLQSIYLEMSKKRVPPRPSELTNPVIKNGHYGGLWADYTRLLTSLERQFAPEEITFLDFETMRKGEGGVIGALLRHLGLDLAPQDLKSVNNGAANVSPLSLASWAANTLSEPKVAKPELVALATESLRQAFGEDVRPCLFTRKEFDLLQDHFAGLNNELVARRKAIQPDFTMSPARADDLTVFRDGIQSAYWIRLSRMLVNANS